MVGFHGTDSLTYGATLATVMLEGALFLSISALGLRDRLARLIPRSISLASTACIASTDTIYPGQSLSGNQTIISKEGNFMLGFFSPGKSSKFYIGIWYNKIPNQTVIWVANRETPVYNTSAAELKLSDDGHLVLLNQFKNFIWSSNSTHHTSNSTAAVLLDNGNLILRDLANNSVISWQSFDHPTDTYVPGGKVGMNKITGEFQALTSWKNSEDPSSGYFSETIDPNGTGEFFVEWNKSKIYWRSGLWNGKFFNGVPEMNVNHFYKYEYVNNSQESYFTFQPMDGNDFFSRSVMDVSGQIKQWAWVTTSNQWMLFWSEPKQCEVYAVCGYYGSCNEDKLPFCSCINGFSEKYLKDWELGDYNGGCVRNKPLQCSNNNPMQKDKFYPMESVRLPLYPQSVEAGNTSSCEVACLNDCSCTAYSYSGRCFLWFGDLLNIQEQYSGAENASTLFIRLATLELPNSESNTKKVIREAIGSSVALLVLLAIVWMILWRWKRRKIIGALKNPKGALVAFRYCDLQRVTNNFSEKLGCGGFGSVFKGVLPDSTAIAVKKLESFQQGEKQFRSEVSTVGATQHVNLIHLLGFCSERNKKCLVYEFMPNGSLDVHLFQSSVSCLNWSRRYQIALGIARGLCYLHEKCRDCIIHCDIKPENILLDAEFIPKVSDFGLAKLVGRDFSRVLTTMRGTRGYLAPEWISGIAITAKADVYSYGMMLFEIIAGKRNLDQWEDVKGGFFHTLAENKLEESDITNLVDPKLQGDANTEEVSRALKTACWCIQNDENSRPSMGQVVQILEGVIEIDMPPISRTIQMLVDQSDPIDFFLASSINQSCQTGSSVHSSSQVKTTT